MNDLNPQVYRKHAVTTAGGTLFRSRSVRSRRLKGKHPPRTTVGWSSSSGGVLLGRLEVPWQKLVQPGGGMIGDAYEHVGEPGLRGDVVELGRGDKRVLRRSAFAAAIGTDGQP